MPRENGGLGFRDFKNFNLALLAKQLWRLIHYPNSLLARVLKGRYFRLSNPIDSNKANNPSYVWRSLMTAQPLLTAGLRKTIGTGQITLVWADPWVPTTPARLALPCRPSFNPVLRVSDLIDPNDLPLIRSLKPTRSDRGDSNCWAHTKSGSYSVKTGYTLAMEMMERPETKPVLEPSFTILQAKIWKLKTTKKDKSLYLASSLKLRTGL